MSKSGLSLMKKFRLSPDVLRFMISQKLSDYPEIRILLRELIDEVNHIGTNINQIVHSNNSGIYSEDDKERLVAHMRKLNVEVGKVYDAITEEKSDSE